MPYSTVGVPGGTARRAAPCLHRLSAAPQRRSRAATPAARACAVAAALHAPTHHLPSAFQARPCPAHAAPSARANRLRCAAQDKQSVAVARLAPPVQEKAGKSGGDGGDDEEPGWGLINWSRYSEAPGWDTPWGWPTIIFGMIAWAVSFLLVGVVTIPAAISVLDIHPVGDFTALQSSELALANQIVATIVGLTIVWSIGRRGGKDTPPDYLSVTLENPVSKPGGWAVWSIAGLALAPFVIIGASLIVSLLPEAGGRGTVDGVASMISSTLDPAVFTNLLLVTGVLAPILEESVFRGFLLTSLTKKMSVPAAVTLSSLAFAGCHLSARDFPQLFALGMVMGFTYVRSRNLMTNIVIHGAWNSGVLTLLFLLVNSGTSMEDILGR